MAQNTTTANRYYSFSDYVMTFGKVSVISYIKAMLILFCGTYAVMITGAGAIMSVPLADAYANYHNYALFAATFLAVLGIVAKEVISHLSDYYQEKVYSEEQPIQLYKDKNGKKNLRLNSTADDVNYCQVDTYDESVTQYYDDGWYYDDTNTLVSLTSPDNNPHLKDRATPQDVMVGDKQAKMYNFDDIALNLKESPHFMVVGKTGSGKSNTSAVLIHLLNTQYQYPMFVIHDAGQSDYEQPTGRTFDEYKQILDSMHGIMTNRQAYIGKMRDSKQKPMAFRRIIWIIEEYEAVSSEMASMKAQDRQVMESKLADLARMGRKVNINLMFVSQTLKATDLNTSIRNNLGNTFVHRATKTTASMFSVPYDINELMTGVCYYSPIDAFVKMPLVQEAKMRVVDLSHLKKMV